GMVRCDGRQWRLLYSPKEGLPPEATALTAEWDSAGQLWVGSANGLFRLEGGRFEEVRLADGRSLGEVDDLVAETNGTLWIASWNLGPLRWDGQEVRPLPAARGVDSSRALRVCRDGE